MKKENKLVFSKKTNTTTKTEIVEKVKKATDVIDSFSGVYRVVFTHGKDIYETKNESIAEALNSIHFTPKVNVGITVHFGIKSISHVFNVLEAKKMQSNKTYCDIIEKRFLMALKP